MAWAKIDDRFFSHPKVRRAGKDAVLLYLAGLTYCNEHLTEGFISEDSLPLIALYAFVDDFKQSASKLLEVGLWEVDSNGYMIHDYFEYNPTRAQVEETKKARAEAGSKGGRAKAAKKEENEEQKASKRLAKSKQNSSNIPSPPLPVNSSPKGEEKPQPYQIAVAMAEVCEMSLEANKGRLLKDASLLAKAQPPPTPEIIRDVYGHGGWWYREDWRGKKDETPNPAAIRETWGKFPLNGKPHVPQTVTVDLPGGGTLERTQ